MGFTFTYIKQTCNACPSQWDAWDAEGNYYYIRYRWGTLLVEKAISESAWMAGDERLAYETTIGDALDGTLETKDMLEKIDAEILPRRTFHRGTFL